MGRSVGRGGVRVFQFDRLELPAQATSPGAASIPAAHFFDIAAAGNDGWDSTGATTLDSVIMASAKPPVKHIPIAPTPRPPHSACAFRASARSHSTIGLDLPVNQTLNSWWMQMADSIDRRRKAGLIEPHEFRLLALYPPGRRHNWERRG
jgi:hypothetical protein